MAVLEDGRISRLDVRPEYLGLNTVLLAALKGGTPEDNADAIRELLAGARGPFRDIVLLNAAAALIVAGKADDLPSGMAQAAEAIDRGRAKEVLTRLIAETERTIA